MWIVGGATTFNLLPITISTKFFYKAGTHGDLVNKYFAGSLNGYSVSVGGDGEIRLYYFSGVNHILDYDTLVGTLTENVYNRVVVTVSTSGADIYINGEFIIHRDWAGTATAPTTTETLKMGVYPSTPSRYYNGFISETAIYNRAITLSEVIDIQLETPVTNSLVSKWFFNEGKGTVINDSVGSNNGTINGATWIAPPPVFNAIGGIESTFGGYKIHVFTNDGTFQVINGISEIEYLIVAGGGSSGGGDRVGGGGAGGGGAGGLHFGNILVAKNDYSIVIGAGGVHPTGTVQGNNGDDTIAFGLTAIGGGGGGSSNNTDATPAGKLGGSGGGAGNGQYYSASINAVMPAGAGTLNQGNKGGSSQYKTPYSGGGGGGAGAVGQNWTSANTVSTGAGGNGLDYSGYFGTLYGENGWFAGGGGGAAYPTGSGKTGAGGLGGGGDETGLATGQNGQPNTGGGAGGHLTSGGSGIILIRYLL